MDHKATAARNVLAQILADETAEPKALPLSLLEGITKNFSDELEIGRGGFAVVYKVYIQILITLDLKIHTDANTCW
uniref:Protein kinase domain-containing protein n=1 Tax=Aegilops tauschii subsp. strangulata TaxID=200361 RepID=A0A453DLE7_AEGTS